MRALQAFLAGVMVAGAAAPAAAADRPVPVVGGYADLAPRAHELRPVIKAVNAQIPPLRRARLVSAARQVVAGTNYRLVFKARDAKRWQATVWHRLDGAYEVTEAAPMD